jgi:hypothetical protein
MVLGRAGKAVLCTIKAYSVATPWTGTAIVITICNSAPAIVTTL